MPGTTAVYTDIPELNASAAALATELELPLAGSAEDCNALLKLDEHGLSLQAVGEKGAVAVDFCSGALRHRRRSGHNEPLGRAVGTAKWPGLEVVDATAGLGRDSFVLADLGARVTLLERHPVVFALLRDGLCRGLESGNDWVAEVCGRMALVHADALAWLQPACTDVVYLDPMFPARRKSARVKKEMRLFQQLLEDAEPPPGLLDTALEAARRRVVVKRPAKAEPLAGREPGFVMPGKTVRFDVYVV